MFPSESLQTTRWGKSCHFSEDETLELDRCFVGYVVFDSLDLQSMRGIIHYNQNLFHRVDSISSIYNFWILNSKLIIGTSKVLNRIYLFEVKEMEHESHGKI